MSRKTKDIFQDMIKEMSCCCSEHRCNNMNSLIQEAKESVGELEDHILGLTEELEGHEFGEESQP